MVQLIAHLWADFALQPGKWAEKKRGDMRYAFAHAIQYGIVFWILCALLGLRISFDAMLAIALTHAIIDRFYPARHIIFFKNWIVDRSLKWDECKETGYPPGMPSWMSVWLMIAVDNTMHLTINYAAIKWLV